MVQRVLLGLGAEDVFRVAQVRTQVGRHLRDVLEQLREGLLVGLDDRVGLVDHVEVDGAVVGVDRYLHRVAYVVEVGVEPASRRLLRVNRLRVRVVVRRRVRVEHPLDPAVDDDRVRVGVVLEERCDGLHPLLDVSDVDDPRVVRDLARDEQVPVAEAERERGLAEEARHLHAGLALVRRGLGGAAAVGRLLLGDLRVNDRVAADALAEVHAGVLRVDAVREFAGGRDPRQHVARLIGVDRVRGRGNRAVTVRVDEVLAGPGVVGEVGEVELTHRGQNRLGRLVPDLVAIDIDVTERIERRDLLLHLERVLRGQGVVETRVVEGRLGRGGRGLVERRVVIERLGRDVRQAERRTCRRDVAHDVRLFLGELVRLHLELLDHRGIDRSHDDRDESPQADRDDREHPTPPPDVHDEQARGRDRDDDEEPERREMRVDVGVGGAVDEAVLRLRERELRQVVLVRLGQGHEAEQHREVHLDLRGHPLERALQPDPTVQVVEHGRHDQDDEQCREDPSGRELQERQPEHVERDVLVKLRVLLAERGGVREQDPVLPLARDAGAHDQREEDGDEHPYPTRVRRHVTAVALDDLVFGTGAAIPRGDAVGDDEVHQDDHEEHHGEDHRGHDLRRQQRPPGMGEADILEPEVVGIEACEPAQAQQQDHQDDGGNDQPRPQAERTTTALDRHNTHPADSTSRARREPGAERNGLSASGLT